MSPARGKFGAIVDGLKERKTWPLEGRHGRTKWRISMYSGQFNMKGMRETDLAALREIELYAHEDRPFVDVAKFPFFGGKDSHPWTESFSTFAPNNFASTLAYNADPLVVAMLRLITDEVNIGLVGPTKIFEKDGLTMQEQQRFEEIKRLYPKDIGSHINNPRALQKYCQIIMEDKALSAKIKSFKRSTMFAFAHDLCESPLCSQLIFLHELVAKENPEWLVDDGAKYGYWFVEPVTLHTKFEAELSEPLSEGQTRIRGYQPVLKNAQEQGMLQSCRENLQIFIMRHLIYLKPCD